MKQLIDIRNMDCMDTMREMDDNQFDLAIVEINNGTVLRGENAKIWLKNHIVTTNKPTNESRGRGL